MAEKGEYLKAVRGLSDDRVKSGFVPKRADVGVEGDNLEKYTCTTEFCDVYNEAASQTGRPEIPRYSGNAQMYEAWENGELPWLNFSQEAPEDKGNIVGITRGGIDKGDASATGNPTHIYNYLGYDEEAGQYKVHGSPGSGDSVYQRSIGVDGNPDDNRFYITLNDEYVDNSEESGNLADDEVETEEVVSNQESPYIRRSYSDILRGFNNILGV